MAILFQLLLQSCAPDQAVKKTLSVVREENQGISTLVRLCGGCQNHLSEEAVPTSEVLQPIKDYTVTASFWVAL